MVEEQGKSRSELWSRSQALKKEVESKFLLATTLLPFWLPQTPICRTQLEVRRDASGRLVSSAPQYMMTVAGQYGALSDSRNPLFFHLSTK